MPQISKQIFFNAPLEKVWNIWVGVERTSAWVYGVQESKVESAGEKGLGFCWSEKCAFGKKVIQMDHKFTEWQPLKRTVISTGLPMGGTMERVADFTVSPQGTEANVSMEWDLGMVGAFFDEDKLTHMMQKSFDETARQWKELAEKQTA